MILKSVNLQNIRSYNSQRIEFPSGSVLLAGDIGSGKSTILLAIEFALFGLKSGELTGAALLSHGSKEGSVELVFDVDGNEIIVKRTLKRGKDRIGQASGYVVVDGVKTDLMPKEIRARIFEVLNYPPSLVSKGQDLIYRFTVYTPQEDMKRIIYEDKDSRLDTLRKVFNIDKYKQIRENAIVYVKSLREKRNNFEGRILDLEEKKKEKEGFLSQIITIKKEADIIGNKLKDARENTSIKKKELSDKEGKIKEHNELKNKLALLDSELRNSLQKREQDKKEIESLQKNVLELKEELKDFKEEPSLKGLCEDKERRLGTLEKELANLRAEKSEINGKVNHIRHEATKVKDIDNCPMCLQEVSKEHKNDIISKSNENISNLRKRFSELAEQEKKMLENLDSLKKETKEMNERLSNLKVRVVKKKALLEKQERLNLLIGSFEQSKKKIGEINSSKIELNKRLLSYADVEKEYNSLKEEYEKCIESERKIELEKNSMVKEIEGIENRLKSLQKEIDEKEMFKKELKRIISLQNFINGKFIGLVGNIEKHVMMTVYHEFNELFQRWFSMLIEDENLNARLDDTFSVVIDQNGYENEISNLSGGEKTSVALAYRLALNKVINDVVSEIKTKDILILDEPTEGFSSNQLDKVRDVLDDIGISQIIIVSHEAKIESFVDTIIRIRKEEGVSLVG